MTHNLQDFPLNGKIHLNFVGFFGFYKIPKSIFVVQLLSVSDSLWPHRVQHTRLPCPSLSPDVCSNSYPLSCWCHPTISSSVAPFSCPQSFPASGSFPMSRLFALGGQRKVYLKDLNRELDKHFLFQNSFIIVKGFPHSKLLDIYIYIKQQSMTIISKYG